MCGVRRVASNAARPSRRGLWRLLAIRPCRHVGGEQKAPNWTKKSRPPSRIRRMTRQSPQHCQVIDLVYYHEKSVDEVAHILDVPPATVKTRMFYARKKLAELVNGTEKVRC